MHYYPVFENLFDDFFTTNSRGTSLVMKTDIVEKDGNYELSIEMLSVKKEDIQMELKKTNLFLLNSWYAHRLFFYFKKTIMHSQINDYALLNLS